MAAPRSVWNANVPVTGLHCWGESPRTPPVCALAQGLFERNPNFVILTHSFLNLPGFVERRKSMEWDLSYIRVALRIFLVFPTTSIKSLYHLRNNLREELCGSTSVAGCLSA